MPKGGENPSAPMLSLWTQPHTQAAPVPRAVLCVNTLLARGRWQKGDDEGSCASSWGSLEKQVQALPSPDSFESSFWQMPGLKSSLCVPKGWINRLLRHNYLPTVPKLVTNKAIVHFHLMQKKGTETFLADPSNSYYHAQLQITIAETFDANHFFLSFKAWAYNALYTTMEYSCLLRLFLFFCFIYINMCIYLSLQIYSWFSFITPVIYLTCRSVFSMKNSQTALILLYWSAEFHRKLPVDMKWFEPVRFYPCRSWHHIFL